MFRPGGKFGPKTKDVYDAKLTGLARVIDAMAPDVLAVDEVGDPEALEGLAEHLEGDWHIETSGVFDLSRPSRVGVLSWVLMTDRIDISSFEAPLTPIRVEDDGATMDAMPRGALRVRVQLNRRDVDVVACHLEGSRSSDPRPSPGTRPKRCPTPRPA